MPRVEERETFDCVWRSSDSIAGWRGFYEVAAAAVAENKSIKGFVGERLC